MQYLVIQQPKQKNRAGMSCGVVIVTAGSAAEAIRTAESGFPEYISKHPDYRKPFAIKIEKNMSLSI